ncbi:telomere-associated protein RIF1 isoform X1 [Alosa sapidissima]|uniref:telomere-associated protein RIF1 isoform X1 n=1 Tax=Alosa sapidissima TaxID=34773 RepID=UPI001C0A0993|nr:telomere-associated protein RIF1 isoform X1 [Alosa sapidissima]
MMATVSLSGASLIPLLDCLEDTTAGQSEQTDAYLTIVSRLSGEDGQQYHAVIVKHFARLGKTIQAHISSENAELSQAALQTLGLCVFYPHIVSAVPDTFAEEMLTALTELVVKSSEKNTCTRALWVISKQNFPADIIGQKVPDILTALEAVGNREDIQSVVMEHEAINVIIRLIEQAPAPMTEGAVQWVRQVIPLVVHSASKVRLRAAAALEMGLPLILEKQEEVAAMIEPMMATKLIPELQKLFNNKNETNVLKLWTLFVKILGKMLHRGGSFINSLLYLEEMGFRSSSPSVKKIAFFAWKSLIDNFALNPEILCSAKRLKLLMLPLSSIQVKTEPLLLTKINVWWYLVVKLGPNLGSNFEQVGVALLQNTIPQDATPLPTPSAATTPSRSIGQRSSFGVSTPKAGTPLSSSPSPSSQSSATFPCVQLLGLEILLHYLLGPQVPSIASKTKLKLCLEPLTDPLLTSTSFFSKHSSVFLSYVRNGFIAVGKDSPGMLLHIIWKSLVGHVVKTIDSVGNKKDRQGSEALTLLMQSLRAILLSDALPAKQALDLLETTVKGIPKKVLGSAAYQVADMDILNGTPALFLIGLFYNGKHLSTFVEDEKFFMSLETLLSCGLSGPTSPLAFADAVLEAMSRDAGSLENKEYLWRMWSVVVNPLTDTITQSNEVNQGDALEHNFNAVHSALMFPISHLLPGKALPQMTQKTLLGTWSRLYMVFARCSALVATAEENVCCEELCVKMSSSLDGLDLSDPPVLDAVVSVLHTMIESVDFSPYTPQFQQKMKSPRTPLGWVRKRNKALGNLSTFHTLLVHCLEAFLALDLTKVAADGSGATLGGVGTTLINIVSKIFSNLALPTVIQEAFSILAQPLALMFGLTGSTENDKSKTYSVLMQKLECLLGDMLRCLQSRSALQYDDDMLSLLTPLLCETFLHKSKQIRTLVNQFWNATFANALVLNYPDKIRPVLSQVKQKTPIILPGFQAVEVPEDTSGQYSSESSQMETKISGVAVTSAKKRESLLNRPAEPKTPDMPAKPVSVKLDFGSSKLPRREMLEEEASVDFVFIPPETKERVLTEHQKEVKRTKRVDIPAMYNNLDASLDTTTFTQYTQSQEESMDKLPADDQTATIEKSLPETSNQNKYTVVDVDEAKDQNGSNMAEPVQDPATKIDISLGGDEVPSTSADISMEDIDGQEPEVFKQDINEDRTPTKQDTCSNKEDSPNVSGSSDMVSGTPQKPNSRRQSFITLEKYVEGRPSSPISVARFTGPLVKNTESQEMPKSQGSIANSPHTPQAETSQEVFMETEMSQKHLEGSSEQGLKDITKDLKPSTERPSESTEDEDVIPDTQTKVLKEDLVANGRSLPKNDVAKTTLEEESDVLTDSQSETSPANPRRSGRQRTKPMRPGGESDEQEGKNKTREKRVAANDKNLSVSKESTLSPSLETDSQPRGRRRSRLAEVENVDTVKVRKSLRGDINSLNDSQSVAGDSQPQGRQKRSQAALLVAPQNSPHSNSQTLDRPGRRTRSAQDTDSQQLSGEAEVDGQSQGRPVRKTRRTETAKLQNESQSQSQTDSEQLASQTEVVIRGKPGRRQKLVSEEDESKNSSENAQVENFEESQESSQGKGRLKTRRSSQLISASAENSDSNASETEGQKPRKRGRRLYSMNAELTHSPLNNAQTSENVLEPQELAGVQSTPEPQELAGVQSTPEPQELAGVQSTPEPQELAGVQSTPEPQELAGVQSTEMPNSAAPQQSPLKNSSFVNDDQMVHDKVETMNEERNDVHEVMDTQKEEGDKSQTENKEVVIAATTEDVQNSTDVITGSDIKSEEVLQDLPAGQTSHNKLEDSDEAVVEINPVIESTDSSKDMVVEGPDSQSDSTEVVSSQSESDGTAKISCPVHNRKGRRRPRLKDCICHLGVKSGAVSQSEPQASQEKETNSVDSNQLPPYSEEITSEEVKAVRNENGLPEVPVPDSEVPVPETETTSLPVKSPDTLSDAAVEVAVLPPESIEKDEGEHAVTEESQDELRKNETTAEVLEESEFVSVGEQQVEEAASVDPVEAESLSKQEERLEESPVGTTEEAMAVENVLTNDDDGVAPLVEDPKGVVAEEEETEMDQTENAEPTVETTEPTEPTVETTEPTEPLNTAKEKETAVCLDSPPKQKCLDAVTGELEVGQSPSSGKTRGMWSPSASPSTSILKKGQKRPSEEDSPSPLLKSRRVSFADPIYQQELADDIDRRSPVIRTSSPRSKSLGGQPKFITTPTKGLLNFSPRNLRSPGYKSSKKCLISEMTLEPRPIPKDCVYPALVACSTPVEAVLPQISSNMWPRGFGQLVRARNIKTVGDLSALTPAEIKALPIRSPKLSNVKKALKSYHEQQRKVRCDDLKGFDEMEKMTSEPEELELAENQDEEKAPEEAQEVTLEEPTTAEPQASEQQQEQPESLSLLSDVQAVGERFSTEELAHYSPGQLAVMYEHLSGMIKSVVDRLVATSNSMP